jgi:hypothetical protein
MFAIQGAAQYAVKVSLKLEEYANASRLAQIIQMPI